MASRERGVAAGDGYPPQPSKGGVPVGRVLSTERKLADANPGRWVTVEVTSNNGAARRAHYLRSLGYDAKSRGTTVWLRSVAS